MLPEFSLNLVADYDGVVDGSISIIFYNSYNAPHTIGANPRLVEQVLGPLFNCYCPGCQ